MVADTAKPIEGKKRDAQAMTFAPVFSSDVEMPIINGLIFWNRLTTHHK